MLFIFGLKASKIQTKEIGSGTACPNCGSKDSFIATTFGRYFHLFWIPMFPFSKTTVLECKECKKSYDSENIPNDVAMALASSDVSNPPKRPKWHSLGFLVVIGAALLAVVLAVVILIVALVSGDGDEGVKDERKDQLRIDLKELSKNTLVKSDSISPWIKTCVSLSIEGINTSEVKYLSKVNNDKLLVLAKVKDMKGVEKSSRKILIETMETCVNTIEGLREYDKYMAVDGKWSMLLVKTPFESDLSGRFADQNLLLPFYDGLDSLSLDSTKVSLPED